MSNPACPVCTLTDVAAAADHFECLTCGHEWPRAAAAADANDDAARVVKDANGNVLVDGDDVVLIKELKLKGGGGSIKSGTKVKRIKIVDGDHELDVKIDGVAIMLKAMFVKKA
ncbi:MAG TPA: zinc ribbon domain-containing protein YjdM [Myxococcota bacterium]